MGVFADCSPLSDTWNIIGLGGLSIKWLFMAWKNCSAGSWRFLLVSFTSPPFPFWLESSSCWRTLQDVRIIYLNNIWTNVYFTWIRNNRQFDSNRGISGSLKAQGKIFRGQWNGRGIVKFATVGCWYVSHGERISAWAAHARVMMVNKTTWKTRGHW